MRKLCDILYRITGVIVVTLMIEIILMTFLQVFTRYIINASIPWAQELIVYSMVWMVLLGCSMGMRKHEVACMDLLIGKLPPKGQKIIRIINNLILVSFLTVLLFINKEVVANAMSRLSGMMRIPMGYVNLSLSISCALTVLYLAVDLYDDFTSLLGKGEEKTE